MPFIPHSDLDRLIDAIYDAADRIETETEYQYETRAMLQNTAGELEKYQATDYETRLRKLTDAIYDACNNQDSKQVSILLDAFYTLTDPNTPLSVTEKGEF